MSRKQELMRKLFAIFLWLVSLAILGFGLFLEWIFRDGMASGMAASHGIVAWKRFWQGGSLLTLLLWSGPPFILGCFLYPLRFYERLPKDNQTESQEGIWPPPPKR